MRCYRFQAIDTWFFRESRPHGSAGSQELSSLFPPPTATLLGALRTLAGDRAGIDWHDYAHPSNHHGLRARIGLGEDLGELDVAACMLALGHRPLFPAPTTLLRRGTDTFTRLLPGSAVFCDLGPSVRLPVLEQPGAAKPLEQAWIGLDVLERVLGGALPPSGATVWRAVDEDDRGALAQSESRLGIGRDTGRGTAIDGLLYQIRHVRPKASELNVALYLSGAEDLLPERATVRLGGEGRLASVSADPSPTDIPLPSAPTPPPNHKHFALYLMAHARFLDTAKKATWLPPGFVPEVNAGFTAWRGELGGASVRLHSAVLGKPVRIGGWDLARQRPKPLVSYVPAGSVYFFSVEDGTPLTTVFERLHGSRIGHQIRAGHGLVACGLWTDSFPTHHQGTPP